MHRTMTHPVRHATLKPDPLPAQWLEAAKRDIERLRSGLIAAGISADDVTIYEAWKLHSDSHAASWLVLYYTDAENVAAIMPHLNIHEGPLNLS